MTACTVAFDADERRRKVHDTCERVARAPASGFHSRTGAAYAVEMLGCDRQAVVALPAACTARFAGVTTRIDALRRRAALPDRRKRK